MPNGILATDTDILSVANPIHEVIHDSTLSGTGLDDSPLGVVISAIAPDLDNKLDVSAFSSVSGDFQQTSGMTAYALKDDIHEYSAGDNIDINGYVISSKDWTNDIQNASANAFNESTAYVNNWIEETYSTDKNALSAAIDYVSANAGDQEVDSLVHSNSATWDSVTNKLDTTAFSDVSGTFLTSHQSLEDYYKKTETSSKEEISAAIASIPLGDVEVNSAVHELSSYWNNKLDSSAIDGYVPWSAESLLFPSYRSAGYDNVCSGNSLLLGSGSYGSTAINNSIGVLKHHSYVGDNSIGVGDSVTAKEYSLALGNNVFAEKVSLAVGGRASALIDSFALNGTAYFGSLAMNESYAQAFSVALGRYNYADNCCVALGVHNSAYQHSITLGCNNYARWHGVAIGSGCSAYDNEVVLGSARNFIVYPNGSVSAVGKISANGIELGGADIEVDNLVHTNSSVWNTVTDKLDSTAFSTVSGDFYTVDNISGFITNVSAENTYQPLGDYATVTQLDQTSSFLSAAIDYVSANADNQEVTQLVQANSGDWNDITVYQSNSSTYLTAVDLSNYYTKNETSGATELADAFSSIIQGDTDVNTVVHTYSANGTWLIHDDVTGFQEKGDYYSASNPSGFLVPNDISNLATISLVEETSGSIVNLIPDVSNFITNASAEATYQTIAGMTAYQPLGDYAEASDLENLSSDFESLSSEVGINSGVWNNVVNKLDSSSYHELTAGTNIDIQNYVISSKDWTNEIGQASAYAYSEATALIPTFTFHYVEI